MLKSYYISKLKIYLQTDNISLNTLKDEVTKFNLVNKKTKDLYKNKIDSLVFSKIDISSYISNLNKLITNQSIYDTSKYISSVEISNNFR
jgi:hypothetical protein